MNDYLRKLQTRSLGERLKFVLKGWGKLATTFGLIAILICVGVLFLGIVVPLQFFCIPVYELVGAHAMYVEGGELRLRPWFKPIHFVCTGKWHR